MQVGKYLIMMKYLGIGGVNTYYRLFHLCVKRERNVLGRETKPLGKKYDCTEISVVQKNSVI